MEAGIPIMESWVLSSAYGEEKLILNRMTEVIGRVAPSDRLEDMKTVVAEACLNAFEHGNRLNEQLQVQVQLKIDETSYLFRITDEGLGFEAQVPVQDQGERGWGLLFIQRLADRWSCGQSGERFYIEIEFQR